MTESKLYSLNIYRHWEGVIRTITYGMVFHSQGVNDLFYATCIAAAPNPSVTVKQTIACINHALSTKKDLGSVVHGMDSYDLVMRSKS